MIASRYLRHESTCVVPWGFSPVVPSIFGPEGRATHAAEPGGGSIEPIPPFLGWFCARVNNFSENLIFDFQIANLMRQVFIGKVSQYEQQASVDKSHRQIFIKYEQRKGPSIFPRRTHTYHLDKTPCSTGDAREPPDRTLTPV
jgi:hypothetical protein